MKLVLAILLLQLPDMAAFGQEAPLCPTEGDRIHWIADFCMAEIGTDDEIAAMDCIEKELQRPFPDDCAARRYFKRALCEGAFVRQAVTGTLEGCLEDADFMGATVRNQGVGN